MTESDLLQVSLNAAGTLLNIFSLFFAIVSAYVVVLYLFLYKAPNTLKFSAFLLLSLAFIFIAAMSWNLQYIGEGIHHAWGALSKRATGMTTLGPPLIVRTFFVDSQVLTAWIAWGIGFIVYAILGYLTFFYRWPHAADE
jgi:hypothetical protein